MQAIDRILAILDIVAEHGPISSTAITGRLELPFSTVARLVRELADAGLLDREPGQEREYMLGWKLYDLTAARRGGRDLATTAAPLMARLRDDSGETVSLHALRGDRRMCIAEIQSERELRRVVPVGTMQRLVGTTGGEVLLAALHEADLIAAVRRLVPAPQRESVLKRIGAVRRAGYSLADNKDLGVSAVSVPVGRDFALTVSGPVSRFTLKIAAGQVADCMATAAAILRAIQE